MNDLPSSQQPPTSDATPAQDTGVSRIHLSSVGLEQANAAEAPSFIDETFIDKTWATPADPTCLYQVLPRFQRRYSALPHGYVAAYVCMGTLWLVCDGFWTLLVLLILSEGQ